MMRIAIISIPMLIGLLTGCSETPDDRARKYFLAGCLQGGTDRALCECAYTKLTEKYPMEFLLIEDPEMVDPEILEQFAFDAVKSVQICQSGR